MYQKLLHLKKKSVNVTYDHTPKQMYKEKESILEGKIEFSKLSRFLQVIIQ